MGSTWKVILAFVGVFIAGAVFGGVFTVRTAKRRFQAQQTPVPAGAVATAPAPVRGSGKNAFGPGQLVAPVMLQRLTTQLKLTDEQRQKVQPIIARADDDLQWLRKENFRNTSRVLDRMHTEIAVLLTDAQRAELEVSKHSLQERLKRAESGERRGDFFPRGGAGGRTTTDSAPAPGGAAPKGN